MQLINCKISYQTGDSIIYTTQLNNNDFVLNIHSKENLLQANIHTNKDLYNFNIDFYIKIDASFTNFITNAYQTWSPSIVAYENSNKSKLFSQLSKKFTRGCGLEYLGEYEQDYDQNASFGLCQFRKDCSNDCLIFASLNEEYTFTKYTYDFERHILKINRNFKGYSVNKHMELAKVTRICDTYQNAINKLKSSLNCQDIAQEKLLVYNTFNEFGNAISQQVINNKIYTIENCFNLFLIGDGYSTTGYDLFDIDCKRFKNGFKSIVDNIHQKGMKAGIWIAPFAISPLAKSFAKNQNLTIKLNDKPQITCPFWEGVHSLDITLEDSKKYLKEMFELIDSWGFDVIYCDCIYMAGCIPTDGKTQAMLINDGIELIKKFANGKTLIFGGVPFLSGINNCDYISLSSDCKNIWHNPLNFLSPQMDLSTKNNLKHLPNKKYLDLIYPCIYTIPNNSKIKPPLINTILNSFDNIVVTDSQIKPQSYPSEINLPTD